MALPKNVIHFSVDGTQATITGYRRNARGARVGTSISVTDTKTNEPKMLNAVQTVYDDLNAKYGTPYIQPPPP